MPRDSNQIGLNTATCFTVSIENNIAHIVLCRPEKRNSMNIEFWDELPALVSAIDDQSLARVIVISSTGPHFTSGLDLNAFMLADSTAEPSDDGKDVIGTKGETFYRNVKRMQKSFSILEDCRIPVLAAIQGGCIGGGVDLTTACDIRYATEDAFFTIFETNIGMTADVGTFPRLAKLIPEGIVKELAYTGRRMPAQEAKEVGLVNAVYPDQEAMIAGVMEVAAQIASKAPLAVYGCKRMINYSRDHTTADSLDYISIWNASMLQPPEMMEAMTANAEKRPGKFANLPAKRS
ncbi:MAG: crotonase/enoyl-CoA hydratase family protein [Pseudomonadales bacterium]|nr:crotonase/enoyl-CoA hydratase family protein [Pseudomonadales bacterium]